MQIEEAISTILHLKDAAQIRNYIDFIQFPYYRNLEINTRIKFDFPLTVFVGQNGCGKSSALHALYGTVWGKTPYDFWFDTKVDPIEYYDDERRRHSFWYSYEDANNNRKEVVKARIKREDNPNYWETSRPLVWAGMQRADGRRSSPIRKNLVYLDFRAELSAFDKFFYFGDLGKRKSRNKQEFIRLKSSSLNKLFSEQLPFISSVTRNLNEPLEHLSQQVLDKVSYILGRDYTSGTSIKHRLYINEGYSVVFQTNHAKYSEANAGSGEMAVVRLVKEVLDAPNYSLILLDEPEVSLHPGAQIRLKSFLLGEIVRKKHQIILTSHSPILIKDLPREAIKVFYQNPNSGRFLVKQDISPDEAFYHLEYPVDNRKNIIVEDKLAKEIIDTVLDHIGEATQSLFHVSFKPGGCSVLKKEFIKVFCREQNSRNYIVFDGDQKFVDEHFNWRILNHEELNTDRLQQEINIQTAENIRFSIDGGVDGGNDNQRLELSQNYLDYYRTNVFYLPELIPEDIIWNIERAEQLIRVQLLDELQEQAKIDEVNELVNTKTKFRLMSEILYGNDDAESIHSTHKLFIQSWRYHQDENFQAIIAIINSFVGN